MISSILLLFRLFDKNSDLSFQSRVKPEEGVPSSGIV